MIIYLMVSMQQRERRYCMAGVAVVMRGRDARLSQISCLGRERRLRDLGLLIGVNDAPSMKQLKPRYSSRQEAAAEVAA